MADTNPFRQALQRRADLPRPSPEQRLQALDAVLKSRGELAKGQDEVLERIFANSCEKSPQFAEWAAQYEPPVPETTADMEKRGRAALTSTENELGMHHRVQREAGERTDAITPLERTTPAHQPDNASTALPGAATGYPTSHGGAAPGCQLQLGDRGGLPPAGTELDFTGRPPRPVQPPPFSAARYGLRETPRRERTGWMWDR